MTNYLCRFCGNDDHKENECRSYPEVVRLDEKLAAANKALVWADNQLRFRSDLRPTEFYLLAVVAARAAEGEKKCDVR